MTLKKMNERSPKETKKVVEKQKKRIPTNKLREQQPCQPPKVSINITEKRENTPNLFSSRTPRPITTKTSHSSLKEGKRKEVTSKQKRPVTRMAKDYHLPRPSHLSSAKGRGASILQTLPVYLRLSNQVVLNRWHKKSDPKAALLNKYNNVFYIMLPRKPKGL